MYISVYTEKGLSTTLKIGRKPNILRYPLILWAMILDICCFKQENQKKESHKKQLKCHFLRPWCCCKTGIGNWEEARPWELRILGFSGLFSELIRVSRYAQLLAGLMRGHGCDYESYESSDQTIKMKKGNVDSDQTNDNEGKKERKNDNITHGSMMYTMIMRVQKCLR